MLHDLPTQECLLENLQELGLVLALVSNDLLTISYFFETHLAGNGR